MPTDRYSAELITRPCLAIDKQQRADLKNQKPFVLWFTGISGAGKTTLANLVEHYLHAQCYHTFLLDGDVVRLGLNQDLGFSDGDRQENIRRVAEVAKLMVDGGLIVLASFISPFQVDRIAARKLFEAGEFVEVYVDTPASTAEARDPKGLYAKARGGMVRNFTTIDSRYEPPQSPEIHIRTVDKNPQDCAALIISKLVARKLLR
ncbi:adenylyl-sulfate kinase [Cupriavidus sp. CuC1]|uniref:adenylyl-sulfate kinase n=1 Tax=Cupriavidus sp. CuC1 TaxID=3373131 RepID=UPI0037CEAEF0